jgi:hypothetical protein
MVHDLTLFLAGAGFGWAVPVLLGEVLGLVRAWRVARQARPEPVWLLVVCEDGRERWLHLDPTSLASIRAFLAAIKSKE